MNLTLSQPDPSSEDRGVHLPVHCTTVIAEDLRVQLVLAVDRDVGVEVDAGAVESVGQATLQLLIAARADAGRAGQTFTIVNPSRAFVERVVACRLADAIGLEVSQGDKR